MELFQMSAKKMDRLPLWTAIYAGLVVNVVPGNDIVEACGGRPSNGKSKSSVECFP